MTLAAIAIITSRGLFYLPFLLLAEYNYKHQVLLSLELPLSVK